MNFGLKILRDRGLYKVMDGDCTTCYLATEFLKEAQLYIYERMSLLSPFVDKEILN